MLPIEFKWRLFVKLVTGFILFTIIGTLSHELGHCSVAKFLGYKPILSYASMTWIDPSEDGIFFQQTYADYKQEIKADKDYPGRTRFEAIRRQRSGHPFWITFGGPAQTIITGTLGIIGLFYIRKKQPLSPNILSIKSWLLVFVSLFWLREAANFIMNSYSYIFTGKWSIRGDEAQLDQYLKLPPGTHESILAIISLFVLASIVFIIIPRTQRFTFLASGIVGGISGFCLWMYLIGPLLFS